MIAFSIWKPRLTVTDPGAAPSSLPGVEVIGNVGDWACAVVGR